MMAASSKKASLAIGICCKLYIYKSLIETLPLGIVSRNYFQLGGPAGRHCFSLANIADTLWWYIAYIS